MLISVVAFAFMQICVKQLTDLPTNQLVLVRSVFTLIFTFTLIKRLKLKPLGFNKKWLILRGVFGTIALTLFFFTIKYLPVSLATTLQYLSPIFTAVFAIFILGEPMAKRQFLFFGLSFLGVFVIKGFSPEISMLLLGAAVLSAIFSGLGYNCIRKLKSTDHPLVVVFYFPLIATPIMGVVSFFNWVNPTLNQWFWLFLMSVFTQIGQYYMAKAYQAEKANRVAGLKYIGVIFAILIDIYLFNYSLKLEALIGMAIIVPKISFLITFKNQQKNQSKITHCL